MIGVNAESGDAIYEANKEQAKMIASWATLLCIRTVIAIAPMTSNSRSARETLDVEIINSKLDSNWAKKSNKKNKENNQNKQNKEIESERLDSIN